MISLPNSMTYFTLITDHATYIMYSKISLDQIDTHKRTHQKCVFTLSDERSGVFLWYTVSV